MFLTKNIIYQQMNRKGEEMKIIHCSDLHLDSKMETNLSKEKAKKKPKPKSKKPQNLYSDSKAN